MSTESDWDSIFTIDKHYEEIPNSARSMWTNNYPRKWIFKETWKYLELRLLIWCFRKNDTL